MTRAEAFVAGLIAGLVLATTALATFHVPGVTLP